MTPRRSESCWGCRVERRGHPVTATPTGCGDAPRDEPQVQLLSRPDSPHLQAIPADSRFGPAGLVRPLWGMTPIMRPRRCLDHARGAAMQALSITELCDVVAEYPQTMAPQQLQPIVRGTRAVLDVLARYPGQTWEQRWLASGYDAAPRTWFEHDALPHYDHWSPTLKAVNALLRVRALRPSYSWLLDSKQRVNLWRFLDYNGGPDLERLRALPAYQDAV